jgi:2-dehydropantoate 2-reductase
MGAGAIGCFVGGHLAAGGQDVTLLGRPTQMEQVAQTGLTLQWPGRAAQQSFPKAITSVADATPPYEFILLTVKAPATATAIAELSGLVSENSYVVSLQNGIGNEEQLAAAFGRRRTIAGTVTIPIRMPQPGLIAVSKAKGGLGLAPLGATEPTERLADALNRAGLRTATYADYRAMKWSKLLLNIITNATCAILNQPPSTIVARPELFNLEIAALQEALAVMQAQGIEAVKLPGYRVDWLARLLRARWLPLAAVRAILRPFLLGGRGTKMPSLHIDLAAGRTTSEVEALNGAVVRAGREVGRATPVNQRLAEIVAGLVAGELPWADYQGQAEKLTSHFDRPPAF